MRISVIAGLVLLFAGIVILVQGGTFTTRRDVLDVGGLKVTASESHSVKPWIAGTALLAGVALLIMGVRGSGPRARL